MSCLCFVVVVVLGVVVVLVVVVVLAVLVFLALLSLSCLLFDALLVVMLAPFSWSSGCGC